MALFHKTTLSPTKPEMISAWLPSQPWCPDMGDGIDGIDGIEVIGAFRFDDPEGCVGLETHLVRCGGQMVLVPMTYRNEPLAGAEASLIGQMEHGALGTRWVYDGLGDDRYLVMLTAVAMTGQGEALGMVEVDGRWVIAPASVRITGGGWTTDRVPVDRLVRSDADPAETDVTFRNERFELTVHRCPLVGPQPTLGLTAVWDGAEGPLVIASISAS